MINNFLTYIKESNDDNFRIGDKVILMGKVDNRNIDGVGTIGDINNHDSVYTNMRNGKIVDLYKCDGPIYYIKEIEWWVSKHNIDNKNIKKIERPDIDPYGEEDWGYEEINNSND